MKKNPDGQDSLRKEAAARFSVAALADPPAGSTDELLHELQVQRIELEMQNEELRRAHVALEESRDRYADLYEFAPVAYLTLSKSGQIAEINFAGTALLGEVRAKLLQRRFANFVAAEYRDIWHRHFQHAFRHAEKLSCELILQRKDGTPFDASLDCLLTVARSAAPTLRIAFADTSPRHSKIMAKLRISEERLRLAMSAARLGLYDRDIVNGLIEWDDLAREFWGYSADEPITFEKFLAGVHPEDRTATLAAIEQASEPRGGGDYHAEYRVINRADGGLRRIAAIGRVFFEDGRAVRSTGMLKDVSALKQLEKTMQERRSEMEMLVNQQVAAHTAAAIAHELNQPLVSISAYSEAALRMLRGGSKHPEKLAHALEGAMEQAQRAGRTLHELLDFLHKGETLAEPVDLNGVVQDAIGIAAESGYDEFRPEVELAPGLPPVLANRLQVQKVLVNLLHNAVEAMRSAGVSAPAIAIKVRTMAEQGLAQVTVQDSGPGLDVATAHRIFEPFFTTKTEGIGLGLAISRALVEAHGGQLWADQDAGGGATFHFSLPLAS